jgi:hypothetical protein
MKRRLRSHELALVGLSRESRFLAALGMTILTGMTTFKGCARKCVGKSAGAPREALCGVYKRL